MNGIVVTKRISREFDCTPQVRYNFLSPQLTAPGSPRMMTMRWANLHKDKRIMNWQPFMNSVYMLAGL